MRTISNKDIKNINKFLEDAKGNKTYLVNEVSIAEQKLETLEAELEAAKEARKEIQNAAQKTQSGLEVHFGNVVTTAIQSVGFTDYEFKPTFVQRRNKTECDMLLEKEGKQFKPNNFVGGGVIDTCAFALRMALWKLEDTAPVIIIDEPFKLVSKGYLSEVSSMLDEIQKEFKIQMIIVTHHNELECGNKKFYIENGEVL